MYEVLLYLYQQKQGDYDVVMPWETSQSHVALRHAKKRTFLLGRRNVPVKNVLRAR